MNNAPPFGFVEIDSRRSTTKPRRKGLSMVIDDGLPNAYARDVIATAGAYIDLMKIKTGTARLYPRRHGAVAAAVRLCTGDDRADPSRVRQRAQGGLCAVR